MITLMRCIEVLLLLLACLFQRLKKIIWLLSGKVCCTPAPNSFLLSREASKQWAGKTERCRVFLFCACVRLSYEDAAACSLGFLSGL